MSKPIETIKTQLNELSQTLSDSETAETYKKTGLVTWTILKETGYLLWLVLCLGLVAGELFWKVSFQAGQAVRGWVNSLEREKPSVDRLLNTTGKNLLSASKSSLALALSTAKDQLGIEPEPEPAVDQEKPVVDAPSKAVAVSAPPTPTLTPDPILPPPSPPTASAPTPPPNPPTSLDK